MSNRVWKESGIEWIGEIPTTWEICKIKNIANLYTGNSIKDELKENYEDPLDAHPYISSKDIDADLQIINYENGMYVKEEDQSFEIANKGDTLMCIEGGSAGKKKAMLTQKVSFVNKLCCFSPVSINHRYLYYHLMSPGFEKEFSKFISGLIGGVSVSQLKNFQIQLPSVEEQNHIADFLDRKVSEIDSVIAKTKESIEEYKKLKQSIITEAVTKGLDPNVEMKDSGIEWIGRIPSKWSVQKFKNLGKCRNGLTYSPEDQCGEEGTLVLRSSNIQGDKLDFEDCVYVNKNISEDLYVKPGDILICSRNGSAKLIGKNALIPEGLTASFGAFMMIYRSQSPEYLRYILNSSIFSYYLGTFLTVSVNQLTGNNFSNIQFPYTDNPKEQEDIIRFLDNKCSQYDAIISKKEQVISELEQYKKSLIYEYVTGKKEVA